MTNFVLIFLCISVGVILSKARILPADAHRGVTAWVINVAMPALILRFVPEIEWSTQLFLPALAPILVWLGAWVFVWLYNRRQHLSIASRTAMFVTCGLGNTGFIGFPMTAAYFGESEVPKAILVDQFCFILFATVGAITVMRAASAVTSEGISANASGGNRNTEVTDILRKLFCFPPFVACLLALILPIFVDISALNPLLDKLVATMSPLALFAIGLQLRIGEIKKEWKMVSAALTYKLLMAPLLVFLLALALHANGNLARISVFEAGMPTHITISLLASEYQLNPRYCSLVVGAGIIMCFLSLTGWYFLTALL